MMWDLTEKVNKNYSIKSCILPTIKICIYLEDGLFNVKHVVFF